MAGDAGTNPIVPFRDRSTGLVVFGCVQILMGALAALMVPLMIASLALAANGAKTSLKTVIPAVGIYGMIAVVLVTLGIGSIRARRSARAITLVGAWTGLVIGVLSMILMIFWLPGILSMDPPNGGKPIPAEAKTVVLTIVFLFLGMIYIVIPGAFILFYRKDDVRRTCELRDPQLRWTDKTPLPVLALSLMLAFGSISMLSTFSYGPAVPLFGVILKGLPALVFILVCCGLFAYLAWGTYKLRPDAWWITLFAIVLFGVSTIVTFSVIDFAEFYRAMDVPEDQIDVLTKMGMMQGTGMPLAMGASFVFYTAYILWLRKYFVRGSDRAAV